MSMGVMEYDSEENDSYNNNGGVVEEQVDWHMDNQSNEKFFHHSNSQMHSFGHHQHPSLPPQQQQQQMNANYMVEQVSEPVRCEVVATSNENSSPDRSNKVGGSGSNNALHSTSKTPNHQFVMGTVKRRGRPPKPDSEKKARKDPKPRGRPPRNSLLQVAIVSKKPSSSSLFPTVNSQQGSDNASLQESPFPLLPSAFNNINNSDSGKKSRGRPRIHPQKDPGLKRPRGRPRVTPLVGEAAWKAECGKMRRLVKKKDQVITILKNKLIELGHNIEEVLMQGRDDVTGGEDDNDEDDENNDDDNQQSQTQHNSSSNNNSIIEGATIWMELGM
ncbi:hypothetical protein HELRODRAFT_159527 [Helobdella robusta]|uniref:Uncharacterized protein n=1 Tax=Helobdella robusta TaxID=6412 RepID=T1EP48_HELRO|nr:hypothetical protein HELRODRAFT_159527 [Helobdella robusta]ESO12937.1 hypothetical protein HELRODRAFT_159527 [Helobdella robusta]